MANKLRWGILSTAGINGGLMGPMRLAPRSELAAVASRTTEKAQAYAAEHGIAKAYGSYDALLADPDIDAIYVSLPNWLHSEWSVKAADAGKHVLCEKAMVLSHQELDAIEAAANRNNVTIFEAYAYLHHPQWRKITAMIAAGELGELQVMDGAVCFYMNEDHDNVRLCAGQGGGALWDVGVYPVTQAVMLNGGPPVEVWGHQVKGRRGVDMEFSGQLRFASGVIAHITGGLRSPRRQSLIIVGADGTIQSETSARFTTPLTLTKRVFTPPETGVESVTVSEANVFQCEVEAMEACVFDGADPVVSLADSRSFLKTILALYESAETGKIVELDR